MGGVGGVAVAAAACVVVVADTGVCEVVSFADGSGTGCVRQPSCDTRRIDENETTARCVESMPGL
jgi:hypothetical protein